MARSGRPPKVDPMKPIHWAVMRGDEPSFAVELGRGEDIEVPGAEGMTPLHIAAHHGRVEFDRALLDAGVEVDPFNVWGNTPLWMAVRFRRRKCPDGSMVRLLVERGADPLASRTGSGPLVSARLVDGFPPELIALLEERVKGSCYPQAP